MADIDYMKYAVLGIGAAIGVGVSKAAMLATIMSNQVMIFGFGGVTVGMALGAAVGVFAADQLVKK